MTYAIYYDEKGGQSKRLEAAFTAAQYIKSSDFDGASAYSWIDPVDGQRWNAVFENLNSVLERLAMGTDLIAPDPLAQVGGDALAITIRQLYSGD